MTFGHGLMGCNQHGCPGLVYEGGFRMVVKSLKSKGKNSTIEKCSLCSCIFLKKSVAFFPVYSEITWNAVAFNPINVSVAYNPVKYNCSL